MKYTLKPINQMNCVDWTKELGVKVTELSTHADGTIEIQTAETDKALTIKDTEVKLSTVSGMKLQE
jgi:thiamine phosphate synthase YjbQ (UPF0047 family)